MEENSDQAVIKLIKLDPQEQEPDLQDQELISSMITDSAPSMTLQEVSNLPALITAHDVVRLTGLSLRHVQLMAKRGEMPCTKIGRRYLFNTARILEMCGLAGDK